MTGRRQLGGPPAAGFRGGRACCLRVPFLPGLSGGHLDRRWFASRSICPSVLAAPDPVLVVEGGDCPRVPAPFGPVDGLCRGKASDPLREPLLDQRFVVTPRTPRLAHRRGQRSDPPLGFWGRWSRWSLSQDASCPTWAALLFLSRLTRWRPSPRSGNGCVWTTEAGPPPPVWTAGRTARGDIGQVLGWERSGVSF